MRFVADLGVQKAVGMAVKGITGVSLIPSFFETIDCP
jgi:hypothetical protein